MPSYRTLTSTLKGLCKMLPWGKWKWGNVNSPGKKLARVPRRKEAAEEIIFAPLSLFPSRIPSAVPILKTSTPSSIVFWRDSFIFIFSSLFLSWSRAFCFCFYQPNSQILSFSLGDENTFFPRSSCWRILLFYQLRGLNYKTKVLGLAGSFLLPESQAQYK